MFESLTFSFKKHLPSSNNKHLTYIHAINV